METIPDALDHRRATQRALLLMTGGAVFFGLMAFSAKIASANLSGAQVSLVRFATGLTPVLLVGRYRRSAMTFQRFDLLLMRGFFGGLAVLLYFLAIEHTSVGIATLLNYTSPIFSGLFSILFLSERISAKVLIPMPIALVGIVMVVQANARPDDVLGFGRWELIGLGSALASGAAVTSMRAARRGENSWAVYASFCLLGTLVTLPMGLSSWRTPTTGAWIALAATSLCAIGAQLLLTFSLRWVDAMTVGVISQLAVLISMGLGATFLGEMIKPLAALGSVLTIGGVIGVVYVTSLAKPRVAGPEAVVPES